MFITMALIPLFRTLAVRLNAMDLPDERKVHSYPMPKAGGLAMALGALIPVLLWAHADQLVKGTLIGAGVVVLFGLFDDMKGLGFKKKFAGQFVAALVIVLYGGIKIKSLGMLLPDGVLLPDWLSIPLTILVIVGVTNAINLSDGLDGLAGGISLLTFACVGYLAFLGGNLLVALLSVAVVGAIIGFLRFNTYPAGLFMGDAGSQLLGFLAVTLSLALTQGNTPLSPLLPLILLGFPILDTLAVMLERATQGRSPFVADKNHLHHKLIRIGLFHTEAVLLIYILQAFLVTSAFLFRFYSEWFLLFLYMIFSGLILSSFFITDLMGLHIKRYHLVDNVMKGKLRVLKEKNVLIKVSFRIIEIGVPSLFFFTSFLPGGIPTYLSFSSLGFLALIILIWLLKRRWMEAALRITIYMMIPFIIYLGQLDSAPWMTEKIAHPYNLAFGFLALFVILTLKLSRRAKGFRSTPMDFLILFVALVVPNLPDPQIRSYNMGMVAAKIIVLFFSYEVIIGELRGQVKRLALTTVPTLVVIALRGLIV